jgi:hypothetical protein
MADLGQSDRTGVATLTSEESLRIQRDHHVKLLAAAVRWITENVIANEMHLDPFPEDLFEPLVQELVENPMMGWPDYDSANGYLEAEFDWKAD